MTNAPVYSRQVVPAADCFDRYSRKRAARAKSSEMSIAVASSRCNSNADAHGAAVHGRSDPLDSDPRKIKTQTRGERGPSPRTPTALHPAPRDAGRSSRWDTPPNALARDHDWWQVSWLAGRRLRPPSQEQIGPQWLFWPSARRLQLRGQLRNCIPVIAAGDAHRIPLVIPLRGTTVNMLASGFR